MGERRPGRCVLIGGARGWLFRIMIAVEAPSPLFRGERIKVRGAGEGSSG
jgi:hypothetical protein